MEKQHLLSPKSQQTGQQLDKCCLILPKVDNMQIRPELSAVYPIAVGVVVEKEGISVGNPIVIWRVNEATSCECIEELTLYPLPAPFIIIADNGV
ncbi:hypothetical protein [Paenibacillus sp. FSL M7-0420]|uniref:hypothetical protein n=1 Tax=Paenibacillus sp. FSL M7-0420 TaxID=2921609 RepID=UPI0030FBB340